MSVRFSMSTKSTTAIAACLMLAGCSHEHVMPSNDTMPISFVTSSELNEESGRHHWTYGRGKFKTWERYHISLWAVAKRYGSVSDEPDPLPDFYHTGDWYHERSDRFDLYSTKGLSAEVLRKFHRVVAAHLPDTNLHLYGQSDSINDITVLITPSKILVARDGTSAQKCEEKFNKLGIRYK